jgi:DMSO/TMAO reductase YedYZ molybdopterin-dependent catalytic subunit
MRRERGLHELHNDDPERADRMVLGRRGMLQGASLAALGAALGALVPFGRLLPRGLIPHSLAQDARLSLPGKAADLVVLGDRPLVAETPAHLLADEVTPTAVHFIRNNGTAPDLPADPDTWELRIDGEVNKPLKLKLGELKQRFPQVTRQLMLECGGNGRAQFVPAAKGNQWTTGGAGCSRWTGVRLADVLKAAELKPTARYTAHFGADQHLSGDPAKLPLSRGVRIEKALGDETLIAFAMNGEPLPQIHGAPVRVLVPGWSGSASQKWLTRIWIRDREHDGPGMTGTSYRLPTRPIVPGSESKGEGFRILESMPVRSLITSPADGTRAPAGTRELAVRGHAWAGDLTVASVHLSADFGQTWQAAAVTPPANPYAWQHWWAKVALPTAGYHEIWARAVDASGRSQPFAAANWNPQGYGANAYHRIAVLVEG